MTTLATVAGRVAEQIAAAAAAARPPDTLSAPDGRSRLRLPFVALHEVDIGVHHLVEVAVAAVRAWAARLCEGHLDSSLVLAAGSVGEAIHQAAAAKRNLWSGTPAYRQFMDQARQRHSGYGCGKTMLGLCALWAIRYNDEGGRPVGPRGRFFSANDLMQALVGDTLVSAVLGLDWGNDRDRCPLIMVDDLGAEQTIPFTAAAEQFQERQRRYFRLVDFCYRHQIGLIITANLNLSQLPVLLGGRTWSRLQAMAPQGQMVDMTGVPDYRLRKSGRLIQE